METFIRFLQTGPHATIALTSVIGFAVLLISWLLPNNLSKMGGNIVK